MSASVCSLWVGALQIMLDNGQDKDWFHPIHRRRSSSPLGFIAFVIWELTDEHPVVDLRVYRYGGFALASVAMMFVFGSFFALDRARSALAAVEMGYTATWAGYVVAFNGVFGIVVAPIAAIMISRVDPRALMCVGLSIIAGATLYRMTFAQNITFGELIPPQLAFGVGMPLFFVPLMSVSMAWCRPTKPRRRRA